MVELACNGTEAILVTFIKRLAVLPNLHTLEVISMGIQYSRLLHKALEGIELPQIRTLFPPSAAHHLIRHCPNVDDLTCIPFRPDQDSSNSLSWGNRSVGGSLCGPWRIRLLGLVSGVLNIPSAWSIDHPSELAPVYPDISELSVVFVSLFCKLDQSILTRAITSGAAFQGTSEIALPDCQTFQHSKSPTSCRTTTWLRFAIWDSVRESPESKRDAEAHTQRWGNAQISGMI